MKIERVFTVEVPRYATVGDALRAGFGSVTVTPRAVKRRFDIISGLMHGPFGEKRRAKAWELSAESSADTIMRSALARAWEGNSPYMRTCALVTLEREWGIPALLRVLDTQEYVPASTSETVAYVRALRERGIGVATVIHLGTHIVSEQYQEQRLFVHDTGKMGVLDIYPGTTLRPSWNVVVAKKKEKEVFPPSKK